MNTYVRRRTVMLEGVDQFGKKPELTLTTTLTGYFGQVTTHLDALRAFATDQVSGQGVLSEGAAERRSHINSMLGMMREMRDIAQVLEQAGNVGLSATFAIPQKRNYPTVVATARSFVEHGTPLATAFTEHGMASTFITDLQGRITAFDASTASKSGGRAERVGGTAAMEFHADAGLKVVQALRRLMKVHLKNAPDLFAAWKSASRVDRRAPVEPAAPTPPDGGSGSGGGSGSSTSA